MKDLDLMTLVAVFQEMLGLWLWPLIVLTLLGLLAFIGLVLKDRGLVSRRMMQAQLAGLPGGALALVIMAKVSSSGFTDAGGPADWLLIGLVFIVGLVGTTVLAYSALGWGTRFKRRRSIAGSLAHR
ncbi:hypothetical protein D7I39_06885 [Allopusillimonas ginsengisoli]|nr:hypothetical protein D7I39_06885 [Allopusillimonas ginsengisoli]